MVGSEGQGHILSAACRHVKNDLFKKWADFSDRRSRTVGVGGGVYVYVCGGGGWGGGLV